ncbi:6-phospho-beta-glucosidase [Actinoallomurus iriomotensis]|uniref:6-phospho-beta-glucosidase n=1 Tax=Actinoallomurus iriomotensis TaxID=478107 RepID=A0A9W6W0Z2_9ACTN|nr:6-phospho-beta-glucosidase [Actinoallomurus iriomotensis]GLY86874.1 6-phospho-beta-glucosidase [Actinoallomurus iriomotensis]
MKLCVVGGGSTYTPELVDGLARLRDTLPVSELVLVDPDERRLEPVGAFSRRILARYGHPGVIRTTTALDEGVEGAAAVLLQLRVGGQAARRVDETLPLGCGCVGQETTGAGGLAKALRTVPVVLRIAERVARLAPDAWIVDFTNPVGIVTRALLDAGHRAVGLCNVAIGFQRHFARALGVPPGDIRLGHVGLNHLTWERSVHLGEEDVLPRLLAEHAEEFAADIGLPSALLRRLGVVPSYYLRYFYEHDAVVAQQLDAPSRAEEVAAIEERLLRMYADPALDTKPELLERRGGAYYSEAAIDLVASLYADRGDVQVVNVRNGDRLPFLPPEAVIEVPARVTAAGADPLPVDPVEPLFAGLIAHVTAYEELALEAALKGGVDRVTDALLAHPLIGQVSTATDLADRLVAANAAHLPWAVDA